MMHSKQNDFSLLDDYNYYKLPNTQNLVKYDDPILTTSCEDVNFDQDDVMDIVLKLTDSMKSYGGIGLAANQIGINKRIICIASNPIVVMINPIITDWSSETVELEEGCLSYPGLVVKVTRPKHIEVEFFDVLARKEQKKFTGMTARIVQHEIQHINGSRFFDVVDWYSKEKVKRWFKKQRNKE